jgi:limonene-1,2-epoxide hydrolase
MSTAEQVVRDFLSLMEHDDAAGAVELMHDDIEWRNTGLPTVRGKQRVGSIIRGIDDSPVEFAAELHHVAATGDVVLTDRTDILSLGRWQTRFWVRGTFEVVGGRILVWDDAFGWGSFLGGSLVGAARAVLPRT